MNHCNLAALIAVAVSTSLLHISTQGADIVTEWNVTLNDAIIATPSKHNPGNPTRAMALMNGAIYDVFQAVERTHAPFKVKVNPALFDANLAAAVAQTAYRTISDTYDEQQATLDGVLAARLGAIADTPERIQAGIDLGNYVAQRYIDDHADDGHSLPDAYDPTDAPFHWSSDPMALPEIQKGWGSDWGFVTPWAMPNPDHFNALVGVPDPNSPEYVDAFDQVKDYGARISPSRSDDQTEIGLFWAYDRPNLPGKPGVGPPPVLFVENMIDIAVQVGNTPADNARMFAMASVAQADAAIASWYVKYEVDLWRPITAIRADDTHDDDNPATVEDPTWEYLGAPGHDPNSSSDDFTPPFPAYTSGHATMGGAIFKTLELFYGTNDFSVADSEHLADVDGVTGDYVLESNEFDASGDIGMSRSFRRFTQDTMIDENMDGILDILDVGQENSPEGENGMSRVYLGVHWLFDQQDGIALGNAVAEYAAGHYFQGVPEPSSLLIALLGLVGCVSRRSR